MDSGNPVSRRSAREARVRAREGEEGSQQECVIAFLQWAQEPLSTRNTFLKDGRQMFMSSSPSPLFEGCPRGYNALTHTCSLSCTASDKAPGQCLGDVFTDSESLSFHTTVITTTAEVRDGTRDT